MKHHFAKTKWIMMTDDRWRVMMKANSVNMIRVQFDRLSHVYVSFPR